MRYEDENVWLRSEMKRKRMKTKKIYPAFQPTPFLLIDGSKENCNKYNVVESWTETNIQVLRDCHFMQRIEFVAHKPSDEELEEYLRGDEVVQRLAITFF